MTATLRRSALRAFAPIGMPVSRSLSLRRQKLDESAAKRSKEYKLTECSQWDSPANMPLLIEDPYSQLRFRIGPAQDRRTLQIAREPQQKHVVAVVARKS